MGNRGIAICGFKQECLPVLTGQGTAVTRLEFDGAWLLENYDISIVWTDGLANYRDLVIFTEKQVVSALERDRTVVLLYSLRTLVNNLAPFLVPFRSILYKFGLSDPGNVQNGHRHFQAKRQEFKIFLERYGLAYSFYGNPPSKLDDDFHMDDLALFSDIVAARAVRWKGRGLLILLPVHDHPMETPVLMRQAMPVLIDAVLKYESRIIQTADEWVKEGYIFSAERPLLEKEKELNQQLDELRRRREEFHKWKVLLSAREYQLQELVPEFLREAFGLPTKRDEQFVEDFWVEDSDAKKLAIGEVTSTESNNVTFGTVGKVHLHRNQHGRSDDFQAILVVNTLTTKHSVPEKDVKIPPNVQKICGNSSTLITRTLDLVRIYGLCMQKKLRVEDVKRAFLQESGWLTVDAGRNSLLLLKS